MTQTATPAAPAAPDNVTRAIAGDAPSFGEIYAANKTLVFRFILKRVRHTPLAEDLTQEVFTRAWKNIGKFDWIGTDIAAWLVMIARNMVADYYRSAYFRKEIPDGSGAEARVLASHDFEARPEEVVIDHLTNLGVLALLDEISPEQREVLVLRFLADLSITETAELLGATEGSIKALQYRGTRSLARAWHVEQEARGGALG